MSPTAIHSELADAIKEPHVRKRLTDIVELCTHAVRMLDSLDTELYRTISSSAANSQQRHGEAERVSHSRESLERLADSVLQGVRELESILSTIEVELVPETDTDSSGSDDFEFDLGAPAKDVLEMHLDDDDIDDALDGLTPEPSSAIDNWNELAGEMSSLGYAFRSQLRDFDERFTDAMDAQRLEQGLREIDSVSNSLIDGVFALMSTICGTYLDDVDRDRLLPGHRNALGKALLVRRGLARLRREVHECNRQIQDASLPKRRREQALTELAGGLSAFKTTEVFKMMRPPDRAELNRFHQSIAHRSLGEVVLVCEGLDKYLDSLASVNQRDVLIHHDREVMTEVANILEPVSALVDISPHGAIDLVRQGFARAEALRGSADAIDELLTGWAEDKRLPRSLDRVALMGQRLASLMEHRG